MTKLEPDIVLATVRRSPQGEEWVDLETVRHHEAGVEVARAAREKVERARDGNWTRSNPAVRIGRFELKEIERP